LSITGFFSANAKLEDDGGEESSSWEWPEPTIAGPIRISFLGTVDEGRSDEFVKSGNDTPAWESTLGFEKGIDGEESGGVVVRMGMGYWVVGLCVGLMVL
jgi:hypothetical protein